MRRTTPAEPGTLGARGPLAPRADKRGELLAEPWSEQGASDEGTIPWHLSAAGTTLLTELAPRKPGHCCGTGAAPPRGSLSYLLADLRPRSGTDLHVYIRLSLLSRAWPVSLTRGHMACPRGHPSLHACYGRFTEETPSLTSIQPSGASGACRRRCFFC